MIRSSPLALVGVEATPSVGTRRARRRVKESALVVGEVLGDGESSAEKSPLGLPAVFEGSSWRVIGFHSHQLSFPDDRDANGGRWVGVRRAVRDRVGEGLEDEELGDFRDAFHRGPVGGDVSDEPAGQCHALFASLGVHLSPSMQKAGFIVWRSSARGACLLRAAAMSFSFHFGFPVFRMPSLTTLGNETVTRVKRWDSERWR